MRVPVCTPKTKIFQLVVKDKKVEFMGEFEVRKLLGSWDNTGSPGTKMVRNKEMVERVR